MSVVAVVIHTLLYMSWMEAEKCWSIPLISDLLFYFYLYPLGVFVLHYHVIKKNTLKKIQDQMMSGRLRARRKTVANPVQHLGGNSAYSRELPENLKTLKWYNLYFCLKN